MTGSNFVFSAVYYLFAIILLFSFDVVSYDDFIKLALTSKGHFADVLLDAVVSIAAPVSGPTGDRRR